MDLVVISSTVNSGNINTKFTDVAEPVVTWESYILDDLKLTGSVTGTDFGVTADQSALDILEPSHPIAGGLSGTVTVFPGIRNVRWGRLASGGVAVASVIGSATQAAVSAFDTGATLIDDTTAPARRVGLYFDNFGPISATLDGTRLALSALCWAAGL
jgi:hypothetical protein